VAEARTQIFSVMFDPDSVVMAYMNVPNDVRVQGMVGLQHQIRIDLAHPDYAEDAAALQHAARSMLRNVLEDFHNSEPFDPDLEDDDDDERGMGDG
jgi:hypothetical protein